MLHEDITEPILGAFYEVHHALGPSFLESVYERSMVIALRKRGIRADRQVPVAVYFDGEVVGDFRVDLLIEGRVIVEIKACRALEPAHEAQVLNLLRATSVEVGLLLHFGHKASFRRLIFTNDRKALTRQGHSAMPIAPEPLSSP